MFYDTDNILETQLEELQACHDCSGLLLIDSEADRGHHILAIHVPRKACKDCREKGYKYYDGANMRTYHQVYLQDRTHDQYLVRKG